VTATDPVDPLRRILRAGGTATGVGLTIGAPAVAQLLARAGFDWLMIDRGCRPLALGFDRTLLQRGAAAALDGLGGAEGRPAQ